MTKKENFINSIIETASVTIANGQTVSGAMNMDGTMLKTIILPAAFTGTEIYFKISDDGSTYYDYYNIDNNRVTITCTQGRAYGLAAIDFYGVAFLKLESNGAEGGDRIIKLIPKSA